MPTEEYQKHQKALDKANSELMLAQNDLARIEHMVNTAKKEREEAAQKGIFFIGVTQQFASVVTTMLDQAIAARKAATERVEALKTQAPSVQQGNIIPTTPSRFKQS